MAIEDQAVQATYGCKCLNIRISTLQSPSEGPGYPLDPNYTPAFVNDDGIQVNHPQATVRLLSKPLPIPGTSRHSRFTALTCLFCALPVYRVHHVISLDIEGNTTTLLPSEDWVEREILKTSTGWIDVHKDSLTRNDISAALSSPSYASLFALVLPEMSNLFPSPEPNGDNESSTQEEESNPTYLPPDMKPVFLPPPFTPSNPVFLHLADIAIKQSQQLRAEAEERIRAFIKAETIGILKKETIIKCQVQSVWKEFKQHLEELTTGRHSSRTARSPSRSRDNMGTNGLISARGAASFVAVKNFLPTPVSSSARHATSSPPQPRVSALSASMATSAFFYPEGTPRQDSEGEGTSKSPESDVSRTSDTQSGSSTLVHSVHQGDGPNVLQFKRNINDDINTQASYRYFVNLEEDVERYKQKPKRTQGANANQSEQAGSSTKPTEFDTVKPENIESTVPEPNIPQGEIAPSRGRDKGKRKVTFDVKPAVVAIANNEKVEEGAATQDQEAMFPLDDVVQKEGAENPIDDQQNTLPLLEQPPPRPITIRKRAPNTVNDAFHSLRPDSLPTPSHIRPIRSPPGVDSSPGVIAPLPKAPSPTKAPSKATTPEPPIYPLTDRDVELLKLVAADTPSHRGAWIPGSENWKIFTGKDSQGDCDEDVGGDIDRTVKSAPVTFPNKTAAADTVQGPENPHIVGSLPIKIKKIEPAKPLSLASYVGQDVDPQPVAYSPTATNGKKHSSNSVRKAVYLEKDRARSMDPGPLDVVVEDDEDEGNFVDEREEGEKARKQALRILQARSELPEEGMWRSLA